MPKIHLSDLKVRSLSPGTYFDDRTPAFGIRVGVNRKTWIVLKQPNRTKVILGHYPDVPLVDARRKALLEIASPRKERPAPPFKEARATFLEKHGANLRPTSIYQLSRTLNLHFDWTKSIDRITDRDVSAAIDAISAKHAAAHALKDIKTFFNWCVPRYLKSSPCHGIKPPARYVPRSRVLSEEELKKVWAASEKIGGTFAAFCHLLIATGQRRNQIACLRWEWINEKEKTISFPADIMKSGRDHRIPYSALTASIIAAVPRSSSTLLFPARGVDKPIVSQGNVKAKLDKLSGVKNHTFHDLRRSYAVGMQKLGISVEVIETLLAHRSGVFGGIVGIYQRHDFMDEMKAAVDKWEDKLACLLEG